MPPLPHRPAWASIDMSAGPGDSPALVARKANGFGGNDAVVVPLDKGTAWQLAKELLNAYPHLPEGHVVGWPRAADLDRGRGKDEGGLGQ